MALWEHVKPPVKFGPPPAAFGPPPPVPVAEPIKIQQSLFGGIVYQDQCDVSPEDSYLWMELFIDADMINQDLARRLEYLRNTGCQLVPDSQYGYKIQPIIDPTGRNGWESVEHYQAEVVCLDPYVKDVLILLRLIKDKKK